MQDKNKTLITPEGYAVIFSEQDSVEIKLDIPKEVLETLEDIAQKKNLSVESVLKFFIGKGVRDLEPKLSNKLAIKRLRSRKVKKEKLEVEFVS